MDRNKINGVFKNLKKKGLLTKEGAFYIEIRKSRSLVLIVLLLFIVFLLFLALGFKSPFFIGVSFLVGYSFLMLFSFVKDEPCSSYWYNNRVVTKNFLGRNAHVLNYSSLESVVRCARFDEKSKRWYNVIDISFRNSSTSFILLKDDLRSLQFLRSCFDNVFSNKVSSADLELELEIFARMLTRGDAHLDRKENECAIRYFVDLKKYRDQGYRPSYFSDRLLFLQKQFGCESKEEREANFQDLMREIEDFGALTYRERLSLFTCLFKCAYVSDRVVDEQELDLLSQIANSLAILEWDFLHLKCYFEGKKQKKAKQNGTGNTQQQNRFQRACSSRTQKAYSLLNLEQGATLGDVKRAYRTQVKSCHPDTLPSNATVKEREEASQRFRTITEAYDFLCAELCVEPVVVPK